MGKRLLMLLVFLLIPTAAAAQTPTGGIEGTVTDATGAIIPAANVTVTETATSRIVVLVTNEAGRFSVRNLVPGLYTI